MVIKVCPVCLCEFECLDKACHGGRKPRRASKRRSDAITCSKKCSLLWATSSRKRQRAKLKEDASGENSRVPKGKLFGRNYEKYGRQIMRRGHNAE